MIKRHAFVCMGLLLVGCASTNSYHPPATPAVDNYLGSPTPQLRDQTFSQKTIPEQWWQVLHSDKLNQLITHALQASPNLQALQATLKQAEHNYAAFTGNTLPQLQANLGVQDMRINAANMGMQGGQQTFQLYQAGVAASYNLDLSGANQHHLHALLAQINYQQYQLNGARLNLASQIAQTAIQQAQFTQQIQELEILLSQQQEQLALVQKQLTIGSKNAFDVLALQNQLQQSQAQLPMLRKQQQLLHHQLALLSGQTPSQMSTPIFSLQDFQLPASLPLQVPSELLRKRPDIRAAEALLQSATAQHDVAIAKLYPQLTLSANIGAQALSAASLFGSGAAIWRIAGQLLQPLFTPGLKAQAQAAESGQHAAAAYYQQTILQAFSQVADILRSLESDAQAQLVLQQVDETIQKNIQLLIQQQHIGTASYPQLLQAQQQLQQSRMNLAQIQARRLINSVLLYQVMGGH